MTDITEMLGNQYMVLEFRYTKFVLPFDDGVAIIRLMQNAESMDNHPNKITEICRSDFSATPMSREEYVDIKMKALIGVKEEA